MDKEVDAVDAAQLMRYLLGLVDENKIDPVAADTDRDGQIDIVDVTLLQRVILNICDWDKNPIA